MIVNTENAENRSSSFIFDIILQSCGLFGLILIINSFAGVSISIVLMLPVSVLLTGLYLYIYQFKRKFFPWFLFFMAVLAAAVILIWFEPLKIQLRALAGCFGGGITSEETDITALMLIIAAAAALLLVIAENIPNGHTAACVLITALVITGPLLGIHVSIPAVLLLLVFQLGFYVSNIMRKKNVLIRSKDGRTVGIKCAAAAGAVFLAALTVAAPVTYMGAASLYEMIYSAEEYAYKSYLNLTGASPQTIQGGHISRINNYTNDSEQLVVQLTHRPSEPIYLKGFTGGDYSDGEWSSSDDSALLSEIRDSIDNYYWASQINSMYSGMYFVMNASMQGDDLPEPKSMSLRYAGSARMNFYMPYFGRWVSFGSYGGYTYQYYDRGDMNIDWDNVADDFVAQRDRYYYLKQSYAGKARTAYTGVPEESLPRLVRLCEEHPMTDIGEITDFIISELDRRTEYSTTPGWSALNTDIAEYFLFERKSGYCVHYATAAALMYRLYGVPARYVSGYIVYPSDFERGEYRTYNAVVTDKAAHAWVEILLDDYGWTPVEVTPSVGDITEPVYPGGNSESSGLDAEYSFSVGYAQPDEENAEAPASENETGNESTQNRDIYLGSNSFAVYASIALPAVIVLLLLSLLLLRRRRRLRLIDKAGCRRSFQMIVDLMLFCGMITDYSAVEKEFPEYLSRKIPSISIDDARRLLKIVNNAAYGQNAPGFEDNNFAKSVYKRAANHVYKALNPIQKFRFKFVKVFG